MSNYHRQYLARLMKARKAKRLVLSEPVAAPYRHPREVVQLPSGRLVIVGLDAETRIKRRRSGEPPK